MGSPANQLFGSTDIGFPVAGDPSKYDASYPHVFIRGNPLMLI
jgi:hypothetical protein